MFSIQLDRIRWFQQEYSHHLTPMFTSDIESERRKSSLSWNGVACKPICNPIVSNRLSILMHFALGHLLQTLHCPHPRATLTALQLAETFCTAAEYSTLHVRRTGCVWTCPRIRAHFFNSTRRLLRFWGHLSSLKYAEIITEFLDMIFLSNSCGICGICGILAVGNSCAEIPQNFGTEPPQSSVSRHFRAEAATLRRNSVVVAPPASTGLLRLPGRKRFGRGEKGNSL